MRRQRHARIRQPVSVPIKRRHQRTPATPAPKSATQFSAAAIFPATATLVPSTNPPPPPSSPSPAPCAATPSATGKKNAARRPFANHPTSANTPPPRQFVPEGVLGLLNLNLLPAVSEGKRDQMMEYDFHFARRGLTISCTPREIAPPLSIHDFGFAGFGRARSAFIIKVFQHPGNLSRRKDLPPRNKPACS